MSGIQEILLIVLIVVGIWLLPRLLNRGGPGGAEPVEGPPVLGGRVRLALLISGVWLAGAAYFLEPWGNGFLRFALIGLGPVALAWGVAWVVIGFRRGS